jgi:hypothetical protein
MKLIRAFGLAIGGVLAAPSLAANAPPELRCLNLADA